MITFNASDFQQFTLDLSDREIYNDIRSECDITEILTIRPDATPEFYQSFKADAWAEPVSAHSALNIYATAPSDRYNVIWKDVVSYSFSPETQIDWTQEECEGLDGKWRQLSWGSTICMLPQSLVQQYISWEITRRSGNTCTIRITNDSDYDVRGVWYVSYLALTPETRYIKLRSINEESIAKYGRRTMDKPWQMGMHPTAQQALIDGDCQRYSEPVSMVSMTIEGKNDDIISKILNLKIDDKHEFVHLGLDMTEQFFINNLDVHHDINGLLEGVFDLEQVRDMERTTFFILDTSLLDSDDVLAW